jgi:hypothetical protein
VLAFELRNESTTYQHYMNDVFFDYLDDFLFAYINNILIFNNSKAKYIKHVKQMLQRLKNAKLQANINKCEFSIHEIKYLNLIVRRNEIKMNSKKIEIILQWSISQNLKQIQKFSKFRNFYRRFIKNFAKIIKSLIKLIQKNVIFNWNETCKIAFELSKKTVVEASILAHFDFKKQIYIKNDFFDFVSAEVLSQIKKNDELYSVTFFLKNFASIACNYKIHDKELLTIVRCFEQWRLELLFTEFDVSIKVLTNHKNLKYFIITKQLNVVKINEFNFLQIFISLSRICSKNRMKKLTHWSKNRKRARQEEWSSETTKSIFFLIWTIRQKTANNRINNNTRTKSIIINAKNALIIRIKSFKR